MDFIIDTTEVLRYLGCKTADKETVSLIEEYKKTVYEHAAVKYIFRYADLTGGFSPFGGAFEFQGEDIKNHLKNCEKCVLMAVTLGSKIENLIRTAQVTDMSKAVILDSCATAAVEAVCDYVQFKIIAEENKNMYMTSRFSPGYGDMPLECQKNFINVLDTPRKIGLTLTESNILLPRKSVTAIIGLSENQINTAGGCAYCNMNGRCAYQGFGGCNK